MTLPAHPLHGLRLRREMRGLKASQLAQRTGVDTASYYRFERGERRIYLDKALTLAHTLQCTVEQLGIEPTADEQVAALRNQLGQSNSPAPATANDEDELPDWDTLTVMHGGAGSVVAAQVPAVVPDPDSPLVAARVPAVPDPDSPQAIADLIAELERDAAEDLDHE
jgi:transcriptional regulator with XRE-family HTH domain